MEQALVVMAGAMLVLEAVRAPRPGSRFLLIGGLVLTFYAQHRLLNGDVEAGRAIYVAGAALLIGYAVVSRRQADPALAPGRWLGFRRWELLAALGVLVLAGLFRFWRIGAYPYGIEGDENSWSIESLFMAQTGEHVRFAEYHWNCVPMSFLMERPFFWIFGYDFMSPRYEVAFFSFISMVPFYLTARRLGGAWVGLIAALLLAVSIPDTAAARVAHVEAHPQIWVIMTIFLLVLALDLRNPLVFLLAGASALGGILTYETFYPVTVVAAAVYVVYLLRARLPAWRGAVNALALALPSILVATRVRDYMDSRRPYHSEAWSLHKGDASGLFDMAWVALTWAGERIEGLVTLIFFRQPRDFLIVRDGSLTNAALVPLFVLGLVVVVSRIRRLETSVIGIWLAVGFLVPTALGDPSLRVVYSGLPAFYLVCAVGVVFLGSRLLSGANLALPGLRRLSPVLLVAPLGAVFFATLVVANWHIYFHEIEDPTDNRVQREVVDTVSSLAKEGYFIILPYLANHFDELEVETESIHLSVASHTGLDEAAAHYQLVEFPDLVQALTAAKDAGQAPAVVHDRNRGVEDTERQDSLQQALRCYPAAEVRSGPFFDVYAYSRDTVAQEECYGAPPPAALSPEEAVAPGTPLVLRWRSEARRQTAYRLLLERHRPEVLFIEAEDFSNLSGWGPDTRFASGTTGRGYLADTAATGVAAHTVTLPADGEYYVWVRSYRRVPDRSQNYVMVDGHSWLYSERQGPDSLNRWVWDKVGPTSLLAGEHTVALSRQPDPGGSMQMFVDSLVLTTDPGFDPAADSAWQPVVDTGIVPSDTASFTVDGAALAEGEYRWRVQVFDGDLLVAADGSVGMWSDAREFRVVTGSTATGESGG
jgi:4-amino-4-deoxy-L-arabinose transferase-like glycosyltransferase